jgi:hypothetical protein
VLEKVLKSFFFSLLFFFFVSLLFILLEGDSDATTATDGKKPRKPMQRTVSTSQIKNPEQMTASEKLKAAKLGAEVCWHYPCWLVISVLVFGLFVVAFSCCRAHS